MSYRIVTGDCRDVLAEMEPESVHAVVTDPPYHLTGVSRNGSVRVNDETKPFGRHRLQSRGFMGQTWDGGDVAMDPVTWAHVLCVLKPGGHLIALCGTRTEHRVVCAIEDAGFEIRDRLLWLYGSGFPKSRDVSKAIDRAAGAEREVVEQRRTKGGGTEYINRANHGVYAYRPDGYQKGENVLDITAPATEDARRWQGWGTALKPAVEIAVLARKPLSEGTVAANVLAHGTGALNVDGCLVATDAELGRFNNAKPTKHRVNDSHPDAKPLGRMQQTACLIDNSMGKGRWPANVLHDGSPEVLEAFERFSAPGQQADISADAPSKTAHVYGKMNREGEASAARRYHENGSTNFAALPGQRRNDAGSAARFFYCAKAGRKERAGSKHPTIKPLALMEWLVRLVTPPGGTVLDPFCGSGSTLIACERMGFEAIGIEQDAKTVAEAHERIQRLRARRLLGDDAPRHAPLPGQGSLFGDAS